MEVISDDIRASFYFYCDKDKEEYRTNIFDIIDYVNNLVQIYKKSGG